MLAFGAHLKSSVCLTRGDEAFLSPHIGDLDNAATCAFLDETVLRMASLLDVRPEVVAHDLHPDYYSTRAALAFAARHGLPTVAVQHHHAHIAAICAEHGHRGAVLGLALDGVGLGSDGAAWGGELLRVHGARCARLGHLRPLPMPGGDRAAREPWRMAAAVLHEAGRNADIAARFGQPGADTLATMLARRLNCPPSSSMGRVFDAAAGLLGLCSHMKFEAQAAMLVEQAATCFIESLDWPRPVSGGWSVDVNGQLDLLALLDRAGRCRRCGAGGRPLSCHAGGGPERLGAPRRRPAQPVDRGLGRRLLFECPVVHWLAAESGTTWLDRAGTPATVPWRRQRRRRPSLGGDPILGVVKCV